jgi:membrane associated rhomboid family serine protease
MTFSKNRGPSRRGWVMLQAPGVNAATLGVLIMIAVHLTVLSVYKLWGTTAGDLLYYRGGLSWDGVRNGQIWQLFTHNWFHGTWLHLALNAALFYYAAARLSHVLGSLRILILFLICGMGAGLVHILSQAAFPGLPGQPLVGASGGVMGMLLGFFALSPESRMLLIPVSARNLAKGVLISSSLLFIMTPGLNLPFMADFGLWMEGACGESLFHIAHLVHFVGGLLGWVMILRFFPRLLDSNDLARMRGESESGIVPNSGKEES